MTNIHILILPSGKEVTEDSMYNLLKKSGVQDKDWLVIAKLLEVTTQTLAGAFLTAWKYSDSVEPSWQRLAKALAKISEGGGLYARAAQQAERNAGLYTKPCIYYSRMDVHILPMVFCKIMDLWQCEGSHMLLQECDGRN